MDDFLINKQTVKVTFLDNLQAAFIFILQNFLFFFQHMASFVVYSYAGKILRYP